MTNHRAGSALLLTVMIVSGLLNRELHNRQYFLPNLDIRGLLND